MDGLRQTIEKRLRKHGPGYAFTRKDLLDLAGTGTLGQVLNRMVGDETIRRLDRGLFDYPRFNPRLGGWLSPDMDQIARALARKFRWTIVPEGSLAANRLGLSRQVPAGHVYLSDGPTREFMVGNRTLRFLHARPKSLQAGSELSATVIQALRHLGRERVDDSAIKALRKALPPKARKQLLKDTQYGAAWMHEVARRVEGGEGE